MIDLATARETFEASTDGTVGIEEEFALLDPGTLELVPRFELLRDAAQADPVLTESIAGELISSEIEIRSGRGEDAEDARARQARPPPAPVHARRRARRRARLDRDAPAQRLPRAAHHRHGALPPRRGRPEVRRVAQQHVLGARPRRRPGRRPRGARLRPAAARAADAAGDLGQLALRRRDRLGPAHRAHADLHEVLPALRRAGRVRLLAGVGGLRRAARAHALDRRVHAAVVVRAPAPRLRHRRGAHLRRPDDRAGGRPARRADRRLRAPRGRGGRRGRDPARGARPADRGEHVAGDPLRPRRHPARPHGRRGSSPIPPRRRWTA